MPDRQPRPARICPACDGFASVKVTLGGRNRTGHLHTITAHCLTCHGTGTATHWLATTPIIASKAGARA
ncbi:hypothetical protein [Streptomyces sp. NPDC050738]|uniref:hypothetical protein n=1 Tax=Streptomyces sp. NPDC050738 TaxID=3154744 RepID=UPI00342FD8F0